MDFILEYYQPNNQYIKIEACFEIKQKKDIVIQFPTWRPGRYELGNFAKNIRNFEVFDENGKKLPFEKIKKDAWSVQNNASKKITVRYFYYAADLNAGSTYMDDKQLYVNPINCLAYIPELQDENCTLTLKIPEKFDIACGLDFNNNILKTKNFHDLVDSPLIASENLIHETYKLNETLFHIWIQGESKLDWKKVKEDFIKFTRYQIKAFSKFPVKEYHFLFHILPYSAYHGVEHLYSTVITLGPSYEIMKGRYDDFLGISSHELYHTWNIKSIRPKEMYPYDYSQENYSKLGYVAEGVTTYLGDLILSASKTKPWEWYKNEFEILLQKHFDNFGRFNYSVAESSFDTWLDGYVPGTPNRKVSIYNEGAILAFVVDMKIRHNSENKSSIHDVMQYLYLNFAEKNKGYTEEEYIQICSDFANEDLKPLFENYFYKANAIEPIIAKALFDCGLEIYTEKNPDFGQGILGLKHATDQNNKTLITHICPGSSSELAGLSCGDEIIAINNISVNNNLKEWCEYFKDEQITFTVLRKSRLLELICPNTNRDYYPIYKIKKVDIPSALQKRIFKAWCGYKWDV